MRALFLLLLLLPLALPCVAQQDAKSLMWRISGPVPGADSYLVGTVHSADARAFTHFDLMLKTMERCDAVVGELDAEQVGRSAATLMSSAFLPAGTDLEDLYPRKRYKRIREAMTEALGPMSVMLVRFKPLYLSAALTETTMRKDSSAVLDDLLQQRARAAGKEVFGLETMQEQTAAMDHVPLAEQADLLYDLVAHDLHRKEMDRMIELHARQDLPALAAMARTQGLSGAFEDGLLVDRNRVMAHRMDSLMADGRTFLFAVGALHLPGPEGLLAAMQAKGHTVHAVRREEDLPPLRD
ncbi:MAG TPA: TraB/GumN family protein [Flavobacteriales bacterium]